MSLQFLAQLGFSIALISNNHKRNQIHFIIIIKIIGQTKEKGEIEKSSYLMSNVVLRSVEDAIIVALRYPFFFIGLFIVLPFFFFFLSFCCRSSVFFHRFVVGSGSHLKYHFRMT